MVACVLLCSYTRAFDCTLAVFGVAPRFGVTRSVVVLVDPYFDLTWSVADQVRLR